MALSEFLLNVRTAAVFFNPRIDFTSPTFDEAALPDAVRNADIWLTPRVVEGFDPEDFRQLSPDDLGVLARSVAEFRELEVGTEAAAPDEVAVRRAAALFLTILSATKPNPKSYWDWKWLRTHRAIRDASARFPAGVAAVFPVLGMDEDRKVVVSVYVVVNDDALGPGRAVPLVREMEALIEDGLRSHGVKGRVSLSLVARSEMAEVIGTHAG